MRISEFQYQQMVEKCNRNAGRTPQQPSEAVEKESELHQQIIQFCKENGWIAFHGSTGHKTHRTIGECDFHCLLPGGIVLFVECKRKNQKLSIEQQAIMAWMNKLSHHMHVITTLEQFRELAARVLSEEKLVASKSKPDLPTDSSFLNVPNVMQSGH